MHLAKCDEFSRTWRYSGRVYYEITSACNLRCIHCYATTQHRQDFIDPTALVKLHQGLATIGIANVVITGGEPTLHPQFFELVSHCAERASVVVTTNGTVLSISDAEKFLRAHPNVLLQVSIDALSLDTHRQIRGARAQTRAVALVRGLASLGLSRQVGISMTVMRANVSEVRPLLNFARRLNLVSVHFPALVCSGVGRRNWTLIAPSTAAQIENDEYLATEMAKRDGTTTISSGLVQQVLSRTLLGLASDCLSCLTLKVTPRGCIVPCPMCTDEQHSLGNVTEAGIVDSLTARIHAALPHLRKRAAYVADDCQRCPVQTYCRGRFCDVCGLANHDEVQADAQTCAIRKHHFAAAVAALRTCSPEESEGVCV